MSDFDQDLGAVLGLYALWGAAHSAGDYERARAIRRIIVGSPAEPPIEWDAAKLRRLAQEGAIDPETRREIVAQARGDWTAYQRGQALLNAWTEGTWGDLTAGYVRDCLSSGATKL